MADSLNSAGVSNASRLIANGQVDKDSSWSFDAEDENKMLGESGEDWGNYSKYHLGINSEADKETKAYYSFPFGKDGKVYSSALRAIRSRAAQFDHTSIYDEAGKLMSKIEGENETKDSQSNIMDRVREIAHAEEDVFPTIEEAEKRAVEMGGEGHHEHVHVVDEQEITVYMPFPSMDAYTKAKEEMAKKPTYAESTCDCEENNCDCDKNEKVYEIKNQTFNLEGIEIFSEGTWNGDEYTAKDLDEMVSSFQAVDFEPPIKLGHNETQGEYVDGQPALGYIDKIYKEGNKLLANFKELPKKVYEAIKRGNYKRVSSEIYWNYEKDGKVFDRVLKAVALLGAEIPAVTNLEAITGLYSKNNAELKIYDKGVDIVETETQEETKDYSIEVAQLKEELEKVNSAKDKAIEELKEKDEHIKSKAIASFIDNAKAEGKVLPVFEKELVALMSHASDEKIFKYSKDDKEVELSQFELIQKIFSSIPKIVDFAELSEHAETPTDYEDAGEEADRRAKIYLSKGRADSYSDAIYKVLEEDKDLKDKYENS